MQEAVRTAVDTDEVLEKLIDGHRKSAGTIALDVETTSTDPMQAVLVGIAIAIEPAESFYVPVGHNDGTQTDAR